MITKSGRTFDYRTVIELDQFSVMVMFPVEFQCTLSPSPKSSGVVVPGPYVLKPSTFARARCTHTKTFMLCDRVGKRNSNRSYCGAAVRAGCPSALISRDRLVQCSVTL